MDFKLSQKKIKEICGTVSFKRGDSFYRGNKVVIESEGVNFCEATVKGTENFQVLINWETGSIQTNCSCPKLSSFQKECQHVAAVLLLLLEHQQKGNYQSSQVDDSSNTLLNPSSSNELLSIFRNEPNYSSGYRLHFEDRKILDVTFICSPYQLPTGQVLLTLMLEVNQILVRYVREFLEDVYNGTASHISTNLTYNPEQDCFLKEIDDVIQVLNQVIKTENMFVSDPSFKGKEDMLPLSPITWERLFPLLAHAPNVKIYTNGQTFEGLQVTTEKLPLQFVLSETKEKEFTLTVNGYDQIVILDLYEFILFDGKLIPCNRDDLKRLMELRRIMDVTGKNEISIPHKEIGFFIEKVVPGLRKLGEVNVLGQIAAHIVKTPLQAKLYLDRVKDRLLAGLEFYYDHYMFNPLVEQDLKSSSLIIRDEMKEQEILQLMQESSFIKNDEGYYLHNEDLEYEFLHYMVPKLQKVVQLYATTAVRNRVFRNNPKPKIRVKIKKERTNWLEFKFEMTGIPDDDIREVLAALEEKRKYYRMRNGSLLSLETNEFAEIQRFLHGFPNNKLKLADGVGISALESIDYLDTIETKNIFMVEDSFREFLESIRNPESLSFVVPKTIEPILRDYQINGYKWLKSLASYGFGGILADDMGLGKTLQAITYILSNLSEIRESRCPVLIVCPTSLSYNWLNEFTHFTPEIEVLVVDGNQRLRHQLLKGIKDMDVIITSYPLIRRDIDRIDKEYFHTVFFDEAQAFKNPLTQTAKAVKKVKANHKFALTGTPVENSIEELWAIFHIVFPELFRGLTEYSRLNNDSIARRVRPFLLRRLKKDVLSELPRKIESLESIELLPDQKTLYGAYLAKLRHETLKQLDKETLRKNRIKILAGLTRLRQICCHPALFVDNYKGSSAKFEQLFQIIEEAKQSGRRVLIFSQFTKMLGLIGSRLTEQGLAYFYLDGQTPSDERLEICNRFNSGDRDYFLISLKAGGTGLNLTGADTVVLYDMWWNPAVEEQAADRAHRMGQKNNVHVIKLVSKGTIEEKINNLQDKKRTLVDEIVQVNHQGLSTLTEEDIRELLMV
ncbi:SNF2 helicase associated domain-containing protein [Bacillus sp. AK128]